MSITAFLLSAALLGAGPGDDGRWQAGQYSFSDELGGFRIQAVSGTGSRSDPVLLRQKLYTASAVVLVIRTTGEVPRYAYDERAGAGYLFIEIETLNASNLPWVEFEFELQEMRGISSVYGDGLSFDQRNVAPPRSAPAHLPPTTVNSSPMTGFCFSQARSMRAIR